jgi:hypothetical protein
MASDATVPAGFTGGHRGWRGETDDQVLEGVPDVPAPWSF